MQLFSYELLKKQLLERGIDELATQLDQLVLTGMSEKRFGDIPRWRAAVNALPDVSAVSFVADQSSIVISDHPVGGSGSELDNISGDIDADENHDNDATKSQGLRQALQGLHPWRKGPFNFFGVDIETEWRSDKKWDRLKSEIEPLTGRTVMDVGCGSGYHCWRMRAAGADFVLGIDPTPLFIFQYWAVQKYAQCQHTWVIPARLEQLPRPLHAFDTVFSMGVLYHRRSPFDHLMELRDLLTPGGQLVLETLVIEGGEGDVLVPEGRYSKMGNVWFIPSVPELCNWLRKMNFSQVSVVDVCQTTLEEQHSTDWMRFQSLVDFLDPTDHSLTVEGYPAPRRAIVTASA